MFIDKLFLNSLPDKPGIYCMLDKTARILYVGKARHLKKRVSSYFHQSANLSPKTQSLVKLIKKIEVTVTHTENEALILENTLIKKHQPRYNILLRDDKTYPYIYLSAHKFPRLNLYRGKKQAKGQYFGPYPHVKAVHESLNLLQKLFPIRQCPDSYFNHRSRPCLQYQIKRCSAPCVGLIDEQNYQEEVQHTILFLQGKSQSVIDLLIAKMEVAAKNLAFEQAAQYRDQISYLRSLQEKQYVSISGGNIDIIACVIESDMACVQLLTVRDGRHIGNRAFFPKHAENAEITTILTAFLPQYYLSEHCDIPDEIIINAELEEAQILAEVMSQKRGKHVQLHSKVRTTRAKWLAMAVENAQTSLTQKQPNQYRERLAALSIALHLDSLPEKMECFDISHTQGEATVASCVVFDHEGAAHSAYRRFNINHIQAGDDYAAMRQVLTRRYQRLLKEQSQLPDIIFIDGGKGQVKIAREVLTELNIINQIRIIGVVKGEGRKAGLERLILSENDMPLILAKTSPALHLVQHIRDEAHRFALMGHQSRRAKVRTQSTLEQIEGIGAKRRQRLLKHFGGLQGIAKAGVDELAKVEGISKQLAQKIYDFFVTS